MSKLLQEHGASTKSEKINKSYLFEDSQQKLLNLLDEQKIARKKLNENFMQNLFGLWESLQENKAVLIENEKALDNLYAFNNMKRRRHLKALQQRIKDLQNLCTNFKIDSDGLEINQTIKVYALEGKLENDFEKLKQDLIADTCHSCYEQVLKTLNDMQNEF